MTSKMEDDIITLLEMENAGGTTASPAGLVMGKVVKNGGLLTKLYVGRRFVRRTM